VRPATFESAAEAIKLEEYYLGPDGKQVNTIFCLLDPKGEALIRSGRSPRSIYASPERLMEAMQGFQESFKPKPQAPALPLIGTLRLGLNIAACDQMPLVVGIARGKSNATKLKAAMTKLGASKEFRGRAQYVILESGSADHKLLAAFEGFDAKTEVQLWMPDAFGEKATLLHAGNASASGLVKRYGKLLDSRQQAARHARQHVRKGHAEGKSWDE
jgi:hypothetical protein